MKIFPELFQREQVDMSVRQNIKPVNPSHIPLELKRLTQWVIWQSFKEKRDGKFDKVPIDPDIGHKIDWRDAKNHLSFDQAVNFYKKGIGDGIGIVLNGKPIKINKEAKSAYLVGVDIDGVKTPELREKAKQIVSKIDSYAEISPSGSGIRIFAFCNTLTKNGRGTGGELYSDARFLTVTGRGAARSIKEASEEIKTLESEWFPRSDKPMQLTEHPNLTSKNQGLYENELNKTKIRQLLKQIPADTDHDTWRDIIWSVASLSWNCGSELLLEWSATDVSRWSTPEGSAEAEAYLHTIYDAYDPNRNGISLGTLYFHAGASHEANDYRIEEAKTNLSYISPNAKFNILDRKGLDLLPPAEWLVHGLIPERGVSTIYGPSGSGKSFLAIDLAISVSNGHSHWFSRRLKGKPVLYMALEGGSGIKKRVEAWEKHNGRGADHLKYMIERVNVLDYSEVNMLIESAKSETQGGLIIIDTLAQATPGFDENSSSDMGKAISAAQALSDEINGAVILVHHTGKDVRKGARGHSSFHAAMDSALEVNKSDSIRFWKSAKVKDSDDSVKEYFDLVKVNLGIDQYGLEETSCVIETKVSPPKISPKGGNQSLALDAIAAELQTKTSITELDAQKLVKGALSHIASSHRSTRAKEAIRGLIDSRLVALNDGLISIL